MQQLSTKLPWEQANTKWASQLNPVLALPILSGLQLNAITLVANKPLVINHRLGRLPQGWIVVDNSAFCSVIRIGPYDPLMLTLESNANTTISIWVY